MERCTTPEPNHSWVAQSQLGSPACEAANLQSTQKGAPIPDEGRRPFGYPIEKKRANPRSPQWAPRLTHGRRLGGWGIRVTYGRSHIYPSPSQKLTRKNVSFSNSNTTRAHGQGVMPSHRRSSKLKDFPSKSFRIGHCDRAICQSDRSLAPAHRVVLEIEIATAKVGDAGSATAQRIAI